MWIERCTEAQRRGLPLGGAATAAKPLERGAYHDVAGPRMSRFHIPDGCAVARLATRPAPVAGLAPPRLEHGDVADQVLRVAGSGVTWVPSHLARKQATRPASTFEMPVVLVE